MSLVVVVVVFFLTLQALVIFVCCKLFKNFGKHDSHCIIFMWLRMQPVSDTEYFVFLRHIFHTIALISQIIGFFLYRVSNLQSFSFLLSIVIHFFFRISVMQSCFLHTDSVGIREIRLR